MDDDENIVSQMVLCCGWSLSRLKPHFEWIRESSLYEPQKGTGTNVCQVAGMAGMSCVMEVAVHPVSSKTVV